MTRIIFDKKRQQKAAKYDDVQDDETLLKLVQFMKNTNIIKINLAKNE